MFENIKKSLKNINYNLFISLIILSLVPTIYTTIRIFLIGQLPNEYSFSIAGQLSYVNLIYEILNEAIILPLFYFIGKVKNNKKELINYVQTGTLISFCIYSILSILIFIFAKQLLQLMATDINILEQSSQYIKIESIANIFSILMQFILVVLISLNKSKYLYIITITKLILCILCDIFLASNIKLSFNLGINGIGYSNIIVNTLLFFTSIYFLSKENVHILQRNKLNFKWTKELYKIGGISGIESLVRNLAYMIMISRMVNIVGEQGTYWVANNFIWGWLLLPILQLGELIKQEIAEDKNNIKDNSLGYFTITIIITSIWFISIPLWKPFITNILQLNDVEKIFELILVLVGFYILYAIQNVFDSTFYGLGKTNYMLFESAVTNSIYYGIAFILYLTNIWEPSLLGIALLFGIGNAFDSIVSFIAYKHLLNKEKINIYKI